MRPAILMILMLGTAQSAMPSRADDIGVPTVEAAGEADYSACSLHTACHAKDVPAATLSAIRSNGDSLEVRCPDTDRIDEAYRNQCQASLEAAIRSLSRWPGELSPPAASEMRLKEEQACIDTSVSGREAADCGHYSITAMIPLRWHEN
jgi:hypothetical protein